LGGDGALEGCRVAVLGLSFKAGTSDTRRSPGVRLANILVAAGSKVQAYDPKAIEEAKEALDDAVTLPASIEEAVQGADAVIIATDWPEFIEYPMSEYAKHMSGTVVVDAMNRFDPEVVRSAGLQYIGVGRR